MKTRLLVPASVLVSLLGLRAASAATYYVATTGKAGNPGTSAAPFATIAQGANAATQPGDTVFIHGGTYTGGVNVTHSGTAAAWITFSAVAGELPILDGGGTGGTGFGSSTAQFIRVIGLASRNWSSSGFGNGWVNDVGTSNGNWQFIQCIADGNGINGITFYNATGLLIDQSIVSHNGNMMPSWSSGVNLFHVSGDYTTNVITRNVSFENIDISAHHTDGSGFILDQNSSGALFQDNIGFRNGGSCIRINTPGARVINNTCYHDGLAPADIGPTNPGEIFFSSGPQGAIMVNNLAAASGWNNTMTAIFNGPTGTSNLNNLAVNSNGATPFFTNPAGVDFTLVSGSTTVIDKGSMTDAPATDIGFDPKCITALTGQAVSWWGYAPDYTYIASVGGIPGCFHPATRPVGAAPDIGAYEFGGTTASCTVAGCNDNNVCTADGCNASNQCTNTVIAGCCTSAASCDDKNACTADACNASNQCTNTAIAGCCTSAATCDDGNLCTTDTCSGSNQCAHAAIAGCCTTAANCDDGDACTADTCSAANKCVHTALAACCLADGDCNDGNTCTADTCTLATHTCSSSPISGCCTSDTQCASSSVCVHASCNVSTNKCTTNMVAGCCASAADCNDNNACTTDSCNTATGVCGNQAVAGCCETDGDCADTDACTVDTCDLGKHQCNHAKTAGCCVADGDCNDSDACTADACSSNQCVHTSSCQGSGGGGAAATTVSSSSTGILATASGSGGAGATATGSSGSVVTASGSGGAVAAGGATVTTGGGATASSGGATGSGGSVATGTGSGTAATSSGGGGSSAVGGNTTVSGNGSAVASGSGGPSSTASVSTSSSTTGSFAGVGGGTTELDGSNQVGGCSCRVVPEETSSSSWAAVGFFGLAAAWSRRRRAVGRAA